MRYGRLSGWERTSLIGVGSRAVAGTAGLPDF